MIKMSARPVHYQTKNNHISTEKYTSGHADNQMSTMKYKGGKAAVHRSTEKYESRQADNRTIIENYTNGQAANHTSPQKYIPVPIVMLSNCQRLFSQKLVVGSRIISTFIAT